MICVYFAKYLILKYSIAVNTKGGLKLGTVGSNFTCLRIKDNGCTALDLGPSLGNTGHDK